MNQTIFFDLDGTLTDPATGITRCIQHALRQLGHAAPHEHELTWCIGPPLRESFEQLVGDAQAGAAVTFYRERFSDVGLFENTLYTGIRDSLQTLADADIRLCVASSKPHVYVNRILAHFALDGFFDGVFGAELDGTRADKTDLLRHALAQTRTDPALATMVGDRKHDAIGAFANGLEFVGVLYGYGSVEELQNAGATRLAHSPAELATAMFTPRGTWLTAPGPCA
jgi:phosphoglycolate phosphatase